LGDIPNVEPENPLTDIPNAPPVEYPSDPMPAFGKGARVLKKRGRGRPPGAKNKRPKTGDTSPPRPPPVADADPFSAPVKDPPAATEPPPAVEPVKQRLGEAQAEILLGILFQVWNGYAAGIPAWALVRNKKPELFDAAYKIWQLSDAEKDILKPPLIAKMAAWELDPDDVLILTLLTICGVKFAMTVALTGGQLPPGVGDLLGVNQAASAKTVETSATPV